MSPVWSLVRTGQQARAHRATCSLSLPTTAGRRPRLVRRRPATTLDPTLAPEALTLRWYLLPSLRFLFLPLPPGNGTCSAPRTGHGRPSWVGLGRQDAKLVAGPLGRHWLVPHLRSGKVPELCACALAMAMGALLGSVADRAATLQAWRRAWPSRLRPHRQWRRRRRWRLPVPYICLPLKET